MSLIQSRSTARGALLVLAAVCLTAGCACTPAPPAPPTDATFVLDQGHMDLFEITWDTATEGLKLSVKDDTGIYDPEPTLWDPAQVVVAMDEVVTRTEVPADLPPEFEFLGSSGTAIWILDETPVEGTPWPGWSTERLLGSLPAGTEIPYESDAVELKLDITGPGDVFTWMIGGDLTPINRYIDTTDGAADRIPMSPSSHTHTSWAFTQPGDYRIAATPTARTTDGRTLTGPTANYRIHIGPPLLEPRALTDMTIERLPSGPVEAGTQVTLSALQEPEVSDDVTWYRSINPGVEPLTASIDGSLSVTVGTYDLYQVVVRDDFGRIVGTTAAEVSGTEPLR